jgi:hypothetical protein
MKNDIDMANNIIELQNKNTFCCKYFGIPYVLNVCLHKYKHNII